MLPPGTKKNYLITLFIDAAIGAGGFGNLTVTSWASVATVTELFLEETTSGSGQTFGRWFVECHLSGDDAV